MNLMPEAEMIFIGLVLVLLAGGLIADVVVENSGKTDVTVLHQVLTVNSWAMFLAGLATGVAVVIGLWMLGKGAKRDARKRREHRRLVREHDAAVAQAAAAEQAAAEKATAGQVAADQTAAEQAATGKAAEKAMGGTAAKAPVRTPVGAAAPAATSTAPADAASLDTAKPDLKKGSAADRKAAEPVAAGSPTPGGGVEETDPAASTGVFARLRR